MPNEQFDLCEPWPKGLDPLMHDLYKILAECEALHDFNKSIETALGYQVHDLQQLKITTASDYLWFMSNMLSWVPVETADGEWVYTNLVVFYWVFNLPPLGNNARAQTQIVPQNVGKPQQPVTKWLVKYAVKMGKFMSTPASWSEHSLNTFKKAKHYNVDWYQGPWTTFNDFFSRHLKVPHPVDGAGDDRVVVSPADCTYKSDMVPVDKNGDICVKRMLWNIETLLCESDFLGGGEFAGGNFVHAFLAPYDYHRQHAPCSGQIKEAKICQGQCYLQVIMDENPPGGGAPRLRPVRPIPPPAIPGDELDLEAPDAAGYQFLQSRGIIVIDNPTLGLVAVLPVGMAQVSSVKTNLMPGQHVNKGDEISWFELGGSDVIMVFQEKAKVKLTVDPRAKKPPHMYQGQQVIQAAE